MPVVAQQIELQTHSAQKVLRLSSVEKYRTVGVYTCLMTVCSGPFSCKHRFEFDEKHLAEALDALRVMNLGNPEEALIKCVSTDDYIRFTSNDKGHVVVSGKLNQHSDDISQSMNFAFRTDQTVLDALIRDLEAIQSA